MRRRQGPNCVDRRRGRPRSRSLTGSGRSVGFASFRNDLRFACLLDPVRALDEFFFDQCRDEPRPPPTQLRSGRSSSSRCSGSSATRRTSAVVVAEFSGRFQDVTAMSESVERSAMEQAI